MLGTALTLSARHCADKGGRDKERESLAFCWHNSLGRRQLAKMVDSQELRQHRSDIDKERAGRLRHRGERDTENANIIARGWVRNTLEEISTLPCT